MREYRLAQGLLCHCIVTKSWDKQRYSAIRVLAGAEHSADLPLVWEPLNTKQRSFFVYMLCCCLLPMSPLSLRVDFVALGDKWRQKATMATTTTLATNGDIGNKLQQSDKCNTSVLETLNIFFTNMTPATNSSTLVTKPTPRHSDNGDKAKCA